MGTIEFTCTLEDFLAAQRLHHSVCLTGRRFWVRIGVAAVAVGAVIFALSSQRLHKAEDALVGVAVYLSVLLILTIINRLFFLPRNAKRQLNQNKSFRNSMKYEVTSSSICVKAGNSISDTPTEDFLKWVDDKNAILLHRSDNMFNFIPKRAVDDAFYAALMAELARASSPRARFANS